MFECDGKSLRYIYLKKKSRVRQRPTYHCGITTDSTLVLPQNAIFFQGKGILRMKNKTQIIKRSPYRRDVYLAKLIDGARRTKIDEYPIIEPWMVAKDLPKEIVQWDQRKACKNLAETALSFYSEDSTFNAVLSDPEHYLDVCLQYSCVIGTDASPYDNMPLVVQKSQIFLNLAITYFYGRRGIKVIPNVRLGDIRTITSLEAYPKNTLISFGTNGFTKQLSNRQLFADEVDKIVESLEPSGIIAYGLAPDWLFRKALEKNIPVYQYDSYMMRRNRR